jgi:PAS domain S-box-containing protein
MTLYLCLGTALLAFLAQCLLLALPALPMPNIGYKSTASLHLVLELFATIVAALIVTASWHTFGSRTDSDLPLLLAGFIVVGVADLMHALTYAGMPPLLGPNDTERAIFFWLMGRSAEVLTVGLMAFNMVPRLQRHQALLLGLGGAAVVIAWGSWARDAFPTTFVPGQGVTSFKAACEMALCAANVLVAARLWQRWQREGSLRHLLLATSAWVMGMGALAFTGYEQPSDLQNIVGHLFKNVGYLFLYGATYWLSLREPYEAAQRAEQRALEGERRLRSLSDNLPDMAVYQRIDEADGRTHFAHLGHAVKRMLGIDVHAALHDASLLYSRLHPDDRALLKAAEAEAARGLSRLDVTVRMPRADTTEAWLRFVAAPRRLPEGGVCWEGVVADVSMSRVALQKLQTSEMTLASVIDSASDAVISCDVRGRIRLFNPAAERIFGRTADSLLGQPLDALLPRSARPGHQAALAGFASSGVSARSMGPGRVTGLRSDGSELALEASISQVNVNGEPIMTAILRDVTERARTERALLQYQLELTQLTHQLIAQEKTANSRLAQVLHDQLGQTLTAMRIDFVSEAALPEPQQQRHARVDALIDQAIREIRQVLVELRPTLLDEQGLLQALDNELRGRRAAAGDIQLRLEAAPALMSWRWPGTVEYAAFMVAREAIANALTHAGASEICVTLEGGKDWLRLEVADDGKGLPVEGVSLRPGHLGMVGMRERSIAIGGQFEIGRGVAGGTVVTLNWENPSS